MNKFDWHKSGGVIIRDRKLLVEKSFDKDFFIAPGGSIEKGETPKQALVRELQEEFAIDVKEGDLQEFDIFYAPAAGSEDKVLRMDVFTVKEWQGEPRPNSEVEEIRWVTSDNPEGIKLGSIFEHDVIPQLKERGLID